MIKRLIQTNHFKMIGTDCYQLVYEISHKGLIEHWCLVSVEAV